MKQSNDIPAGKSGASLTRSALHEASNDLLKYLDRFGAQAAELRRRLRDGDDALLEMPFYDVFRSAQATAAHIEETAMAAEENRQIEGMLRG